MAKPLAPSPVLLVSGEYPPDQGGVADYTHRLRAALEARGLSTSVLTRARPQDQSQPAMSQVSAWDFTALDVLLRAAPRGGIVHVQYQAAAFDLRGEICLAPLLLRARRPDVQVVTTFHDARVPYVFPKAGPLRHWLLRVMASGSHAVLAADPSDLLTLGASLKGHVVPIGSNVPCRPLAGYDREAFRAGLGLGKDALAVVYFGFLNTSKGLDTLLETFRRVARTHPSAWLLALGGSASASDPTDQETARAFQIRLGPLTDRVIQTGYLATSDLSAYLLAGDVALLPYGDGASARRGSLLACAQHGLPIVSTRGSGMRTLPADAFLACPPGDSAQLAAAVETVARDDALRARLQAASRDLAARTSWDAIADRHFAIYHERAGSG